MMIKSEDSSKLVLPHQDERNAVRETHFLVRILFKEFQGGNFVVLLGTGDNNLRGSVDVASSLGREQIAGSTGDERECLIEDEVTCQAGFARPKNLLPSRHRLAMILISPNVLRDKSPGIDENHKLS